MKTIQLRKLLFVAIALLLAFQVSAEKKNYQERKVKSFDKISVSSGIDLYLAQASEQGVHVVADEKMMDKIITEVSGSTLKIYIKNNNWTWNWNKKREVYVNFTDLKALDVSAGADVLCDDGMELDEIRISVSSGADLDLQSVNAKAIYLSSSSGADARISGKTDFLSASSSSGSDINCKDLEAKEVKASASSGSDIGIYVTEKLTAGASSGADISYRGNPQTKDINESSGGDVSSN